MKPWSAFLRIVERLSLRTKLLSAFALIMVLGLVPAAIIEKVEEEAVGALERIVEIDMRVSDLALRGVASFLNARRHEKDFLLRYREFGFREARARYATQVQASVAELQGQMLALRKVAGDRGTRGQTEQIERAASEYLANFLQTVELYELLAVPHRGLQAKLRGTLDELSPAVSSRSEPRLAAAYLDLYRAAREMIDDTGLAEYERTIQELGAFERTAMAALPAGGRAAFAAQTGSFRETATGILKAATSIAEHRSAYLKAAQRVEPLLDTLHITRVKAGEDALVAVREHAKVMDRYAIVSSVTAVLLTLILAIAITLRISRGVVSLVAYTGEITHGHFDAPAPIVRDKELGQIAAALGTMAGRLGESRNSLQARNAELAGANEALLQKERLLSESQRLGHIGSWLFDMKGPISWSEEMYRLFGVSPDTFIPTPEGLLSLMHPDDRPAMQAWIAACAAGEKPAELEYRVRMPDGTIRFMRGGGEAVHNAQHEFVHMAGTVQDITEAKHTEAELQRVHAELEQRMSDATTANDSLRRQTEELRRLNGERAALASMNELLTACANPDEAYEIFGRAAAGLFPSLSGALHIFAASRNQLTPAATWGTWPDAAAPASPESCWGLRRGKSYVGNGTTTPPCGHAGPAHELATLCAPLTASGEVLGLLHLRGPDAAIVQATLQLATMAADGLALHLANLRLRESLKAQSIRDPLTDLFNRRYLTETLAREFARVQRAGAPMAVIMLDVDHFKRFNDSFGHDAGDAVLRELGAFLRQSMRADDIACRYGGEEFCLVLPQMDRDGARERAELIRTGAARLKVKAGGRTLDPVTLSLGVAVYPENGADSESLLRAADAALYLAKREGRNRVMMSPAPAAAGKAVSARDETHEHIQQI